MKKRNVLPIVLRKKDMQIIPVKRIFTIKINGTRKAHLVAVRCKNKEKYSSEDIAFATPSSITIC